MERAKRVSVKEMWKFCLFQAKNYGILKFVLVFGTVTGASVTYVNSFVYAKILDSLLSEEYDTASKFVVILVLLVMALELLTRGCKKIFSHYTAPSEEETKKRTARKAFEMEYEEIEKTETLQSFRRVRQGENGHGGIKDQLDAIYQYFTELVKVVFAAGFVGVLLAQSDFGKENIWQFLLSTAVLILVFAGVLYLENLISQDLGRKNVQLNLENEKTNSLTAYIGDIISSETCAQDIRLYHLNDYLMKKWNVVSDMAKLFIRTRRYSGKKEGMVSFALQILAGVTYVYIVLKALAGSISTGEVLMYAGAIITMMDSIRQLMRYHMEIDYANEYLKVYEEFINLPNMHYDGTLPIEKRTDNCYELEFRNVSFRYPDTEQWILKNVSLKFNVGEKLALVGRNGAGKTTLIKLLLRLYEPTEGEILLNGINIGKYDYEEYTQIFSVVFQDFKLYHFPLDENIAGSSKVDEERIKLVLEEVGLTGRVEKMRDGIHTILYHETGDGESLSGGEAQKAAIARALYKDAPFVILDEPTAALDPVAEAEIYEQFGSLVGDKTSIYISHRMSSCKFCDKIVVLEAGEIAEAGCHEELMQKRGCYYELYEAQAQYYV